MSLRCLLGLHKNELVTHTDCRPFIDDYGRRRLEIKVEAAHVCERCLEVTELGASTDYVPMPKGTLV